MEPSLLAQSLTLGFLGGKQIVLIVQCRIMQNLLVIVGFVILH